jgi:hypothetical protein
MIWLIVIVLGVLSLACVAVKDIDNPEGLKWWLAEITRWPFITALCVVVAKLIW